MNLVRDATIKAAEPGSVKTWNASGNFGTMFWEMELTLA